jgi:hypothetical protein
LTQPASRSFRRSQGLKKNAQIARQVRGAAKRKPRIVLNMNSMFSKKLVSVVGAGAGGGGAVNHGGRDFGVRDFD